MRRLQSAIETFPDKAACADPNFCAGRLVSLRFLRHAEGFGLFGTIMAVDNPRTPFTENLFGPNDTINHYIAYFPALARAVDWTARQFWNDSPVPVLLTNSQIEAEWQELPFQWQDARTCEQEVAGARI